MVMPNFLDKLFVKTPSYNIFQLPRVHNKLTMEIGRNVPVKYYELHAGEEIDVKFSELTRFMPMTNPIFHSVNLEFIPFFVPFRLLKDFGFDGENFFNPATPDSERVPMPMINPAKLYSGISRLRNSIWDYLRYPTFSFLIRNFLNSSSPHFKLYQVDSSDGDIIADTDKPINLESVFEVSTGQTFGVFVDSSVASLPDNHYGFTSVIWSFYAYVFRLLIKAAGEDPDNRLSPYYTPYYTTVGDSHDINWDEVYKATGKRSDEIYSDYLNYLHLTFVERYLGSGAYVDDVSLLPWLCYNRLIYDWFINTGVQDVSYIPQMFKDVLVEIEEGSFSGGYFSGGLAQAGFNSHDSVFGSLSYFFPSVYNDQGFYSAYPARSLWQRDYFTGSFVSSQSGDAVPIPANGTIPDLAGARKLQWFRTLNLFGGKRFIDQIFAHRGVKSSDARLDRCEVIGEKKVFKLQISDVLQTSQSTIDSVQGDFSGHGISYAGDHLCHYRAEEPGLVMIIGRCRPALEYMENTPKLLLKSDFYDFENPEFDNVGMQPIFANELEFHKNNSADESNRIFSWTRRYADYLTDTSEIHGDFKTSLSNWHMARSFNSGFPSFGVGFGVIRAAGSDDLNRIFANPRWDYSVLMDLTFDTQVSRPLSKVVEFDF